MKGSTMKLSANSETDVALVVRGTCDGCREDGHVVMISPQACSEPMSLCERCLGTLQCLARGMRLAHDGDTGEGEPTFEAEAGLV
jgi:hypothetical protein